MGSGAGQNSKGGKMRMTGRVKAGVATSTVALALGLGLGACGQGGQPPAHHPAPAASDRQPRSAFPDAGQPLSRPSPAHLAPRHATAVHEPAVPHAPAGTGMPGPSSPPPPPQRSGAVPMTRTTGGQFGGGTQNPCNTPAGAGLGDCTPGGGAHAAPGQAAPTQAPDGTPAQNACARSLAAGNDSCANAPPDAPGLGLPPDEAPSGG